MDYLNMNLNDVLKEKEIFNLLKSMGLISKNENLIKDMGDFLSLKGFFNFNKMKRENYMPYIEKIIIDPKKEYKKKINILCLLPCMLKEPVNENLKNLRNSCADINYLIKASTQKKPYYKYYEDISNIDDFPEIMINHGFNIMFELNFKEEIEKSEKYLKLKDDYKMSDCFEEIDFNDPKGKYIMLGANPWVMVYDKSVKTSVEKPKTWNDILKEEYRDKIALHGHRDHILYSILLYFYKEGGHEILDRLVNSTKNVWHNTKMAKYAGRSYSHAAPINIMSYIAAKMISTKENIEIIIPEDGVLLDPVFVLAKKSEDNLRILDFLRGEEIAKSFSDKFFLHINKNVKNKISDDLKLNWIGWDYINSRDIRGLIKELNEYFLSKFEAKCEINKNVGFGD